MKHREKLAIYKPKRKALEETNPADNLISDFQPPELSHSLSHLICGTAMATLAD